MEGIAIALVPMFAWGSIGVLVSKFGGSANQQTFGMTLGAFLFSLVLIMVNPPHYTIVSFLIGILGGVIWVIGQSGNFNAIKYMGVSVASPLSGGSQLVLGGLFGAILFHEWTKPIQYFLGTAAIIILIIGFYFSSRREKSSPIEDHRLYNYTKGFRAIAYSTCGYVFYTILFNNIMNFDVLSATFPMAIGMVIASVYLMRGAIPIDRVTLKNGLVGIIWGIGNVCMMFAADTAGLAIAYSFSQLAALISLFGGIIFLGEKKTHREMRWVLIGSLLFVFGALLMTIVKVQ